MPETQVRVVGSGYTTFQYKGKAIAFCEGIEDSGQRAFSDLGQPYQFIHPIGAQHPVEIATSRVLGGGTLMLTIRELWNTAVWEQLAGLASTYNIVEIYAALAKDPSYVTCQSIIKPPGTEGKPGKWRGKTYHNCFAGETEYLTDRGTRTLADSVGERVRVLGKNNAWQDAEIREFGEQPLLRLTLQRQGRRREFYVTADHRWIVSERWGSGRSRRRDKETTTAGLVPGDRIANRFYHPDSRVEPSAVGVQAGVVYGDGGRDNARGCSVSLWGDKDAALLKYFPLQPTRAVVSAGGVPGVAVLDLPGYFKDAPSLRESRAYLTGWLAGYFAADGTVDESGGARLTSRSRESITTALEVCQVIGVPVTDVAEVESDGYNGRQPAYTLTVDPRVLGEDFFLIPEHRDRVRARLVRDPKAWSDWTVVSVEETDRVETVYCAVVPHGQEFTLAGNVRTGNCIVVDINDGDTITVGALAVTKGITIAYTHTTPLNS